MMNLRFINRRIATASLGLFVMAFANPIMAETELDKAIEAPVLELHSKLIAIMENADKASFQDRYTILESTIKNRFDTPLIVKVVLSRYWKSLDEHTQTDFIDMFNRLTISTYVSRFDSFDGEIFKTLSIEPMKKNRFLVKTEMTSTNDDPVSFDYIVQKDNEQWKIISVIADGINDLSLKRAEYSVVIKDKGFNALVADIEQKIRDLQPGSE